MTQASTKQAPNHVTHPWCVEVSEFRAITAGGDGRTRYLGLQMFTTQEAAQRYADECAANDEDARFVATFNVRRTKPTDTEYA